MDYSKSFKRQLFLIVLVLTLLSSSLSVGAWFIISSALNQDSQLAIFTWFLATTAIVSACAGIIVSKAYKPLGLLSDAIVFAGHSSRGGQAPNSDKLRLGREMVSSLVLQVYDLARMSSQTQSVVNDLDSNSKTNTNSNININTITNTELLGSLETQSTDILDHISVPIIGISPEQNITVINKAACEYLDTNCESSIGRPIYDVVKLSFQNDETFEDWISDKQKNVVTSNRIWERVRIANPHGDAIRQFDLAASFSKNNQTGTETMLTMFDRTDQYGHDDQDISFVALAVHELRTPLTIMKGYIEVFEDEVGPTLNPELTGFMHKMQASAQQLTSFVGNILNVARIQENQLVLKLQENKWSEILKNATEDLSLRAGVHGKSIELSIDNNIPPVAVDRISIHEVINNLVDNAIKYSGNTEKIVISSVLNQEGMVETSVQDFGIGIPTAVMPDLFKKFYRSHKSSAQVGGTGLGLYLCKAVVNAHGGNIWVRSKESEGSTFTFTIEPFDHVKHEQAANQDGIMRGAHGWIKNHSLNRQ